MSKTVAFIQARMSSTRFPGKVLEPLNGLPMIVYMTQRVQQARLIDQIVVVTSTDPSDDPLVEVLEAHRTPVFRGDLHDVLRRFADAADKVGATEVVRLTGDCPLIDPVVIDAVIQARRSVDADYASNVDPPTFPDGLDVECFTAQTLQHANIKAHKASEREHVSVWMRDRTNGMKCASHRAVIDASALRWTVDYPDDLAVIRALIARLPSGGPRFDWLDLMRVLQEHPELAVASPHARNEGLAKSLATDCGANDPES